MGKIRGKFAPLNEELAEDERWLIQCNDSQKLLFQLILLTVYTNNGTAPDDAGYYRTRYNLRARLSKVKTDLEHIKSLFPKLVCTNKKLSLTNSAIYKNRVADTAETEGEVDKELELEKEVKEKFSLLDEKQKPEPEPNPEKPPVLIDTIDHVLNRDDSFDNVMAYHEFRKLYPPEGLTDKQDIFIRGADIFYKTIVNSIWNFRLETAIKNYKNWLAETGETAKRISLWLEEWTEWELPKTTPSQPEESIS